MSTDSYHATRWLLIAQEQQAQAERIRELQRLMSTTIQRVEVLEAELAMLKAAWVASRIGGQTDGHQEPTG